MITACIAAIKSILMFLLNWGALASLIAKLVSLLGAMTVYAWTALSAFLFAFFGRLASGMVIWFGKGLLRAAFMPFAWIGRHIWGKVRRA